MSDTTTHSPRFVVPVPIRFAHCDPAGIIFFPQYLVLFHGVVEQNLVYHVMEHATDMANRAALAAK